MNSLRPTVILALIACTACSRASEPQWLKGNLHTHSLWSDGDQFPEVILHWYKERGYDFVAMSDHNVLADSERWVATAEESRAGIAIEEYRRVFGSEWVETRRDSAGEPQVRLKRFEEYADRLAEPGRFLVIQSEEITDRFASRPVHVNATNLAEFIPPQGGGSVVEVLQNNIDAVLEQRRSTGRLMVPHVNHPNFGWAMTAEDLMAVRGENLFEVYNGHPLVHNGGDSLRPSIERIWDIILTHRVSEGGEVMYGIAVDDSHHYGQFDSTRANPGRGWIMVRASELTPEAIVAAIEAGAFYGSSGVVLEDVVVSGDAMEVRIRAEPGVSYVTEFVGTKVGYDDRTEPVADVEGLPVTRRYSADIGEVLAEIPGATARYEFTGEELYVRARVRSSRRKANPVREGEFEMAWVQPVLIGGRDD